MQRREVIQAITLLLGSTAISPVVARVLEGYIPAPRLNGQSIFSTIDQALITEIADTIIPDTTTPGAKQAGVGSFIQLIVDDCYTPEEQQGFKAGLSEVDKQSQGLFKKKFLDCSKTERIDVLRRIEAKGFSDRSQGKKGLNFWFSIKELTVTGYFTSEIGSKQALDYVYIPAKYEACIDIKPEQKASAM